MSEKTTDSAANFDKKTLSHVQFITFTAIFTAFTYIFTAFVNIRLPIAAAGGLIHLGNVPLFLCSILFGKKCGAIAGGVGMGIFDLLSGWALWAPFTFVIVALMGYTVGAIAEKHQGLFWDALAIAAACLIKITGYYLAEVILYGNWLTPAASIPGNLIQIGVAAIIVLLTVEQLKIAKNLIIK